MIFDEKYITDFYLNRQDPRGAKNILMENDHYYLIIQYDEEILLFMLMIGIDFPENNQITFINGYVKPFTIEMK